MSPCRVAGMGCSDRPGAGVPIHSPAPFCQDRIPFDLPGGSGRWLALPRGLPGVASRQLPAWLPLQRPRPRPGRGMIMSEGDMLARVLTLRFDAVLEAFDDSPLQELLRT